MSAPVKGGNVELSGTGVPVSTPDDRSPLGKAYDEFPYEGFPYPLTHPSRLAAIGALFSMRPPSPGTARVLELGCGTGGNLIPMAFSLPKAQFVGYDLSNVQVQEANATISALGLNNIRIEQRDIIDIPAPRKKFDYVICHGVFSWVPENVQDKIFSLCRDALSENGIALVSYNTYPGWHMRESIRHMMLYHARQFPDPKVQVAQARALLGFLAESVSPRDNPYGMQLESELKMLSGVHDSYIAHDHLERWNTPIYFHQFVERASKSALQYLGESDFGTMIVRNFPQKVATKLSEVVRDGVQMEQYMDFLRNRTFRSTLLCHAGQKLDRSVDGDRLSDLYVSAAVEPSDSHANLASHETAKFRSRAGMGFSTGNPVTKIALAILSAEWPRAAQVKELLKQALEKLANSNLPAGPDSAAGLAAELLQLYASNAIELHATPSPFVTTVSDKPCTTALTRLQAAKGHVVTNQRHEVGRVHEIERKILCLLDGSRGQREIVASLVEGILGGDSQLNRDGESISDPDEIRTEVTNFYNRVLPGLAHKALLIS